MGRRELPCGPGIEPGSSGRGHNPWAFSSAPGQIFLPVFMFEDRVAMLKAGCLKGPGFEAQDFLLDAIQNHLFLSLSLNFFVGE